MDLRSHYPYWLLRDGIINTYPSLQKNERCDVVIIGAGITGALAAWFLSGAGIKVMVVDKRHVGMGSTAASTSLLQYEVDVPLTEMIAKTGEKNAIESYRLCLDAITEIGSICNKIKKDCGFVIKPSMQFASYKKDLASLEKEYKYRLQHDFPVHWLDENAVEKKFGFKKPGAILSDIGAELNAYCLTHQLLAYCADHYETKVFDKTAVVKVRHSKKRMQVLTKNGHVITCNKVIIACGYESQAYLPVKVETFYSTYAIISEPFDQKTFWYKNSLIWETADPYLYMRVTKDNRIITGGKDIPFSNPDKRDAEIRTKTRQLETTFSKLFPHIDFKTDFSWAGTFASTKDGLPYIGELPQKKGLLFALGYGGNGITFSLIAGKILRDILLGKKNRYAHIFKFGR